MDTDRRADLLELTRLALSASSEAEWWEHLAAAVSGPLFAAVLVTVNVVNAGELFGWSSVVHPVQAREKIPVGSTMDEVLLRAHPFTLRQQRGPVTEPMKVTDLISRRQWRQHAAHDRTRELAGGTHQMVLALPRDAPYVEVLSIVRADRDFDEEEMARASRLQTAMQLSVRHLRHVAARERRWGPLFERESANAAAALGITVRERAVLDLIGSGASPSAVGRRLGISVGTVYRHEQNLCRKLRVPDRLNAVLRARRLGLLRDDAVSGASGGGAVPLTRREGAVLTLLATGMSNAAIGETLLASPKTVGVHVGNVLRKLDARTRAEAVAVAYRRGLLQ